MAQGRFSAQVSAWTRETKERMAAVYKESAQRTIELMQEPGPSKASTNKAITTGAGLGKVRKDGTRGVSKKAFGPVHSGGTGNLPVDTGFLRASLIATIGTANFATTKPPEDQFRFNYDASQIALVIARAKASSPIEAVYTAVYARVAEYGGTNRPGRRFVALAAQQWPRIVDEVCREAQTRAGS